MKGVSYIFMWRFIYPFRCWNTTATDFIASITRFEVAVRILTTSWIHLDQLMTLILDARKYGREKRNETQVSSTKHRPRKEFAAEYR